MTSKFNSLPILETTQPFTASLNTLPSGSFGCFYVTTMDVVRFITDSQGFNRTETFRIICCSTNIFTVTTAAVWARLIKRVGLR